MIFVSDGASAFTLLFSIEIIRRAKRYRGQFLACQGCLGAGECCWHRKAREQPGQLLIPQANR
jgi:hypothetical protein